MVNVTRSGEFFECVGCGNIVEVKKMGGGELMCCGQAMKSVNPVGANPATAIPNMPQNQY